MMMMVTTPPLSLTQSYPDLAQLCCTLALYGNDVVAYASAKYHEVYLFQREYAEKATKLFEVVGQSPDAGGAPNTSL